MSLRLILIRHAKSSWSDPLADDHARVLNNRGRTSARAIGVWAAERGYQPQKVLCSDAARTRETAELFMSALATQPEVSFLPSIYHAAPDTMLDLLKGQGASPIAIIGHNPGIGMLANALVSKAPPHPRFTDYPTGATSVIDFAIGDWRSIQIGIGQLIDFVVPRDLIEIDG